MSPETTTLSVSPAFPLRRVRDFIRADGDLPDQARESLALVATELVTNAFKYGEQPVELAVTWLPGTARIIVRCGGQGFDWRGRAPRPTGEGGWGLVLVDATANRWGIERLPDGNEVWAELDHQTDGR